MMLKEDVLLPDGDFFSAQRQQRLDLILHLIPNTRQEILLRGPEKSGKSFFISQFKAQANAAWSVCSLEAKQMMGSDEPLEVIAKAFDELDGTEKQPLVRLTAWSKAGKTIVICVEDVHQLDKARFDFLFQLTQNYDCLHLLLTSSDNLGEAVETRCQLIDLEPLSQKETLDYAKSRVHTKGLEFVNIAGIDSVVLFIETGGLPGRINDALNQMAHVSAGDLEKKAPFNWLSAKWTVAALLIIGILLSWNLFSLRDEGRISETETVEIDEEAVIVEAKNEPISVSTLDPPLIQKGPLLLNKVKSKEEENIVLAAAPLKNKNLLFAEDNIEAISEAVTKEPAVAKIKADEVEKHRVIAVNTQPIAEKKKEVTAEVQKTPGLLDINHKWIKERAAEHYTLQLLGVSTERAAKEFVAQHKDLKRLVYFKNKRNEGQWFSVIYGDFLNKAGANEASKLMPASLSKIKPWLRTFKAVQKELFIEN